MTKAAGIDFKNGAEGVSPFKQSMLWNFASALGITNEQAIEIISYTATHIHNQCVADPSLRVDLRPFVVSLFRCFPIFETTHIVVFCGLNEKVDEVKPSFFDEVIDRVGQNGLAIAVFQAEADCARKFGLN